MSITAFWDEDVECVCIDYDNGYMRAQYTISTGMVPYDELDVPVHVLDCSEQYKVFTDDPWTGEHTHMILLDSCQMEGIESGDVVINKRTAELVPVDEISDESTIATDEFFGMGIEYLSIDHLDAMCERCFVEMPYAEDDLVVFVAIGD